MIITRIYQACTQEEKDIILSKLKSEQVFQNILKLMEKYEIKKGVIRDVERSKSEIRMELTQMQLMIGNKECLDDFLFFVNDTIERCYLRI